MWASWPSIFLGCGRDFGQPFWKANGHGLQRDVGNAKVLGRWDLSFHITLRTTERRISSLTAKGETKQVLVVVHIDLEQNSFKKEIDVTFFQIILAVNTEDQQELRFNSRRIHWSKASEVVKRYLYDRTT